MKTLEIKKDGILNEMETILKNAKDEKGNARSLNADEKTKWNAMQTEATELSERINQERFILEQQKKETPKSFDKEERKLNEAYDMQRSMRNFIMNKPQEGADREAIETEESLLRSLGVQRKNPNSLLIPDLIVQQRSTNTTSSLANFTQSVLSPTISMAKYPIAYKALGVQEYTADPGNFILPSLSRIVAAYVTEDGGSTSNDLSLTSAQKVLSPGWLAGIGEFSRQFLASSLGNIQTQMLEFFQYACEVARDTQVAVDIAAMQNAALSGGTTNKYSDLVKLNGAVPFSTAVLTSRRGASFWKTVPTITGTTSSAIPVLYNDGLIDGVKQVSSFVAGNGLVAFGNWNDYGIVRWSNGYEVFVDNLTSLRKSNIILSVGQVAAQGVANQQSFAYTSKGSFL